MLSLQGRFVGYGPNAIFLKKHICSGGQGSIYEAAPSPGYRISTSTCAVKVIRKAGMTPTRHAKALQEFLIHRSVSAHPNIVTCRDFLDDTDYLFGVLDIVSSGDLHYAINEKAIFWQDSDLLSNVFGQILDAVSFCHSRQIAHLDLKPENVLCTHNCRRVYITDFGVATSAAYSQQRNVGTTPYMAPEVLEDHTKHKFYDPYKADLWSLGCIFLNMIGGEIPWYEARPDDDNFTAFLAKPEYLADALPISTEANVLARRMLEYAPSKRPSLRALRQEITFVRTFFMDEEGIKHSSDAARGIALLAACTKRDWMLKEARRLKPPADCIADVEPLDHSLPTHPSQSDYCQWPTPQFTSAGTFPGTVSVDSLFHSSESSIDLSSLCEDDDDAAACGSYHAVDDEMQGFDDVSLQSPRMPLDVVSSWMIPLSGGRDVLPGLARDVLSGASTHAPSTPLQSSTTAFGYEKPDAVYPARLSASIDRGLQSRLSASSSSFQMDASGSDI